MPIYNILFARIFNYSTVQPKWHQETRAVQGILEIGSGARLLEQQVYKNTVTGGWRLVFHFQPDAPVDDQGRLKPLVEMRAFLRHGADVLTETWSYAVAL